LTRGVGAVESAAMIPDPVIDQQRNAAQEGALIWKRPDLGTLTVSGKDRVAWLNGLVTCDLATRKVGDGAYGLAVGKTGKILTDLTVLLHKDRLYVAMRRDGMAELREHFEKHVIMEDVELTDASDDFGWIWMVGPFADELVNMSRAHTYQSWSGNVAWAGARDGACMVAPIADVDTLAEAMVKRAGRDGALATDQGIERVRIDLGLPRWGVDFDDTTLPQEASLERLAVSFKKGCYLGQEAVFMLEERGHPKKRLVRLEIDGPEPVPIGADITIDDGFAVGVVTSAVAARGTGSSLALGFVKFKHAVAGQEVEIRARRGRILDRAG
jgi:hypothetical protein